MFLTEEAIKGSRKGRTKVLEKDELGSGFQGIHN